MLLLLKLNQEKMQNLLQHITQIIQRKKLKIALYGNKKVIAYTGATTKPL